MKRKTKEKKLRLHPSLLGMWTPRRCLYLGPATEIEELCKLLNLLQTTEVVVHGDMNSPSFKEKP